MGLLDDIEAEASSPTRDYGCSVCRALEALPATERRALVDALGGRLSERAILRVSKKHRLGIGKAGIKAHRDERHDS